MSSQRSSEYSVQLSGGENELNFSLQVIFFNQNWKVWYLFWLFCFSPFINILIINIVVSSSVISLTEAADGTFSPHTNHRESLCIWPPFIIILHLNVSLGIIPIVHSVCEQSWVRHNINHRGKTDPVLSHGGRHDSPHHQKIFSRMFKVWKQWRSDGKL